MALFKTNYPELSFYVAGERKQFSKGEYRTDDKKEIEVLDKLLDAVCDCKDEPKQEKAEEKPAPKKAPARKPSAK